MRPAVTCRAPDVAVLSSSTRRAGPSKNHSAFSHGSCSRAVGVENSRAVEAVPSAAAKLNRVALHCRAPSDPMPSTSYSQAVKALEARPWEENTVEMPHAPLGCLNTRRMLPVPCVGKGCVWGCVWWAVTAPAFTHPFREVHILGAVAHCPCVSREAQDITQGHCRGVPHRLGEGH